MEIERRQLEMSRLVNIIEETGWQDYARSVDGEKMYLSIRRKFTDLSPEQRRMVLDDLLMIVKVFGWVAESQSMDEDKAKVRLVKSVVVEEQEPAQ